MRCAVALTAALALVACAAPAHAAVELLTIRTTDSQSTPGVLSSIRLEARRVGSNAIRSFEFGSEAPQPPTDIAVSPDNRLAFLALENEDVADYDIVAFSIRSFKSVAGLKIRKFLTGGLKTCSIVKVAVGKPTNFIYPLHVGLTCTNGCGITRVLTFKYDGVKRRLVSGKPSNVRTSGTYAKCIPGSAEPSTYLMRALQWIPGRKAPMVALYQSPQRVTTLKAATYNAKITATYSGAQAPFVAIDAMNSMFLYTKAGTPFTRGTIIRVIGNKAIAVGRAPSNVNVNASRYLVANRGVKAPLYAVVRNRDQRRNAQVLSWNKATSKLTGPGSTVKLAPLGNDPIQCVAITSA